MKRGSHMTTRQLIKLANKISIKYSQKYDFFQTIKDKIDSGEIDPSEINKNWNASAKEYTPEEIQAEIESDERSWARREQWEAEEEKKSDEEGKSFNKKETNSISSSKKQTYPIKKVDFLTCFSNFYNLFNQQKSNPKINITDDALAKMGAEYGKISSSEITSSSQLLEACRIVKQICKSNTDPKLEPQLKSLWLNWKKVFRNVSDVDAHKIGDDFRVPISNKGPYDGSAAWYLP